MIVQPSLLFLTLGELVGRLRWIAVGANEAAFVSTLVLVNCVVGLDLLFLGALFFLVVTVVTVVVCGFMLVEDKIAVLSEFEV